MALFNALALQEQQKPHPVEISLGHIMEDGKKLPVTLTLNVSKKLMRVFAEAEELYHASTRLPVMTPKEIKRHKRLGKQLEAKLVSDHVAYCKAILEEGYLGSQNILDEPTKENIILAVETEPGFAEQLSLSLNYALKGQDKYAFMDVDEDAEKN